MRDPPKVPLTIEKLESGRYMLVHHVPAFGPEGATFNGLLATLFQCSSCGGYENPVFKGNVDEQEREIISGIVDLMDRCVRYENAAQRR